jgi:prolyl oligopeptidase
MIQSMDGIYVKSLKNGFNDLLKVDLKDDSVIKLEVPVQGTIELRPSFVIPPIYLHQEGLFILLGSWNKEWQVYYFNPIENKFIDSSIRPQGFKDELTDIAFKELEVHGHDGERIPLSIIYNKATFKGESPAILYGYGSYGSNINPFFDSSLLSWLNRGGIFAVAHVRGGGEKGHDWYMGGYKETKPNSWKDFISCAEYLIDHNYTTPAKLAAEGESAGGITVGRAITERPDLFKAAVISVGALNPLRDETTSNTLSVAEFGTIKDSLEFHYLNEMDVYQHIEENVNYPSLLLTAGKNDHRVAPWQPAKVAAKMQQNSNNLILFNLKEEGHISYSPETEKYAFLLWQLGHKEFTLK